MTTSTMTEVDSERELVRTPGFASNPGQWQSHRRVLRRARQKSQLRSVLKFFGLHPLLDVPYRNLLQDAAAASSVPLPPLYPVKAAANNSLLYSIFRIVTETDCKRVLEIGAGQSSLLLGALMASHGIEVDTLESTRDWARRMSGISKTRVHYSPLSKRSEGGITAYHFDNTRDLRTDYQFVVVDGPHATPRYSRYGALEILQSRLAEDFVVVFDDAERKGEQDTIRAFLASPKGQTAGVMCLGGTKWQCVLYSKKYSYLQYI
jgi:predicted O-methyltransferase YrrM